MGAGAEAWRDRPILGSARSQSASACQNAGRDDCRIDCREELFCSTMALMPARPLHLSSARFAQSPRAFRSTDVGSITTINVLLAYGTRLPLALLPPTHWPE